MHPLRIRHTSGAQPRRIGNAQDVRPTKADASSRESNGVALAIFGGVTRAWPCVLLVASLIRVPASALAETDPSAPALPIQRAQKDVSSCRKLPAGRRIVKLNLKPETSVSDLVAWISAVTCKPFIVPSALGADTRKVTVYAPEPMTPEEAYQLFLGALDSVGLTVYRDGRFLRVIEVARAKTSPIPLLL